MKSWSNNVQIIQVSHWNWLFSGSNTHGCLERRLARCAPSLQKCEFLDAITSSGSYPCHAVGQWVIDSFSYRISELYELVSSIFFSFFSLQFFDGLQYALLLLRNNSFSSIFVSFFLSNFLTTCKICSFFSEMWVGDILSSPEKISTNSFIQF